MQLQKVIRNTAYVVGFVWSLAIAVNGAKLSNNWSKGLSFVPLAVALTFALYDNVLWRWRPILPIAHRPDLAGTWLGHVDAEWLDVNEKLQRSTGLVALVIKQSFTRLSIVLLAEKSRSFSIVALARQLDSGEFAVDYIYANSPKVKYKAQLPAHTGSAELTVSSVRPLSFTGEYWTDRLSRGSLDLQWVSSKRVSQLADAQALPVEPRRGAT